MIRVFNHQLLTNEFSETEIEQIKEDFKKYKSTSAPPDYFGKDVPYEKYNERHGTDLHHLHIRTKGRRWRLHVQQINRNSGQVLVYTKHWNNDNIYLFIAVIKHWNPREPEIIKDTDKDPVLMDKLAGIAEKFNKLSL